MTLLRARLWGCSFAAGLRCECGRAQSHAAASQPISPPGRRDVPAETARAAGRWHTACKRGQACHQQCLYLAVRSLHAGARCSRSHEWGWNLLSQNCSQHCTKVELVLSVHAGTLSIQPQQGPGGGSLCSPPSSAFPHGGAPAPGVGAASLPSLWLSSLTWERVQAFTLQSSRMQLNLCPQHHSCRLHISCKAFWRTAWRSSTRCYKFLPSTDILCVQCLLFSRKTFMPAEVGTEQKGRLRGNGEQRRRQTAQSAFRRNYNT